MRSEAWRPAAAACNRLPREARDPARQALRPGCEELAARIRKATARRCRTAGAEGDGSAAPRPKTATVERREASVPRHGTQGASLGAWRAALCARRTGVPPSTRTSLGAPPTPRFGVSEAKVASLGRQRASRERDGLFDIVSCERRDARPHPEERARRRRSANFERVRASRRMRTDAPSCFETHRSATMLGRKRARSRCDAPQHEGRGGTAHFGEAKPMCPHWKSSPRKRGPMITGRWSWVPALRRRTDPRLQETIAGSVPLFADCYLQ